jgi:hypothetical protein
MPGLRRAERVKDQLLGVAKVAALEALLNQRFDLRSGDLDHHGRGLSLSTVPDIALFVTISHLCFRGTTSP